MIRQRLAVNGSDRNQVYSFLANEMKALQRDGFSRNGDIVCDRVRDRVGGWKYVAKATMVRDEKDTPFDDIK